uniref:MADF domain-containing protein n=1 Tax=Ditylenchus dipsaci TaxID=166011 RepID=A0A915EW86_9BILA
MIVKCCAYLQNFLVNTRKPEDNDDDLFEGMMNVWYSTVSDRRWEQKMCQQCSKENIASSTRSKSSSYVKMENCSQDVEVVIESKVEDKSRMSDAELLVFFQEVYAVKDKLFGKFSGSEVTKDSKDKLWREVAARCVFWFRCVSSKRRWTRLARQEQKL